MGNPKMKHLAKIFTGIILVVCLYQQVAASDTLRAIGFRIHVTDMDKALDFYAAKLGFTVRDRSAYPAWVALAASNNQHIYLAKVGSLLPVQPQEAYAGFSLQVNNLDETIAKLKAAKADFADYKKRKEGVGYAISVNDPFGLPISLMQITIRQEGPVAEPKIYNWGYTIPTMDTARKFYTQLLGFIELTTKYLPLDMPIGHADRSFGFMLHERAGKEAVEYNTIMYEHVVFLFQTPNLQRSKQALQTKGVRFLQKSPQPSPVGWYVDWYDPFGYISQLIELK